MPEDTPRPQINMSKLYGGGGIAGAMFTFFSMLIFLIGIPALRYFLPAAIVLGCGVALAIHFARQLFRHETPGTSWILPARKK